jgi:hypothetical protein
VSWRQGNGGERSDQGDADPRFHKMICYYIPSTGKKLC